MVNLRAVQESNAALRSAVSHQISVFVGSTSGIGFAALLEYARNANKPKIYIVGRGDAKLAGIIKQLQEINPDGIYSSIKSEISLFKNVNAACDEVMAKEKRLDLLLMCPGYLKLSRVDNADGLEETFSLRYYVRMRFIQNLLPLLLNSTTARVINIHGAGREGRLIESDLGLNDNFSLNTAKIHSCTMSTLALSDLAKRHPSISFLHIFPGIVITPAVTKFCEDWWFPFQWMFTNLLAPFASLFTLSLKESGERNLFHATSSRYPSASSRESPAAGLQLPKGVNVANGEDGKAGSGCYLVDWNGETIGDQKLLDEYRERGMGKRIWEHNNEIFDRVLGQK